jgi:hypothetical protein
MANPVIIHRIDKPLLDSQLTSYVFKLHLVQDKN